MNTLAVGLTVFACTFGGALLGMALRRALPAHHLDDGSKDTIKLGIGLVATMTALVLGLVTASAKSSYDAVDTGIKQTAVDLLVLDRALARYGAEAAPVRAALKQAVTVRVDSIWPPGGVAAATQRDPLHAQTGSMVEALASAIRALKPQDEEQRALRDHALAQAEALLRARWLLVAGTEATIPLPFLVVVIAWLAVIFTSFGLFAPRHGTVQAVLLLCAASVASALFLVLEMETPFDGLLRVSDQPLRYALAHLGR
jgi:hypothetical protein